MSDIVIKTENLGKSYIIGHERKEKYSALRDVLANKTKNFANIAKQIFKGGPLMPGNVLEEFWALKDINFEIKQGDRVGIIGRNGAGKSTLLKVLSRITEPTTGRITIRGRVASLLEVGTGFHPELSGRENIFLNGAILGMSQAEVKRKFDEIVDFSGVEQFLDTPVKRYSSGMYVRLAFAVAAHLEPEILVVDEVLAVGDAEFQKKCLGKMEDVSLNQGRTVLFVSHNMTAIESICNQGILLNNGQIQHAGIMNEVIDKYLDLGLEKLSVNISEIKDRRGNQKVKFIDFKLFNNKCLELNPSKIPFGEELIIKLKVETANEVKNLPIFFAITLFDNQQRKITTFDNLYTNQELKFISHTDWISCKIPDFFILPGKYYVELWSASIYGETYDILADYLSITIIDNDIYGSGKIHNIKQHGVFITENIWSK